MRQNYLNKDQVDWLKENHSQHENQYLADELTKMVQISSEKEMKELINMLPSLYDPKLREEASKRILFLRNPVTITADYVKYKANSLGLPPKKRIVRATSNRRVAKSRHLTRWKKQAISVEKPVAWFRTLKTGSSHNVKFSSFKQMKNFLDYLYKWNREEGQPDNIKLFPDVFKEDLLVHICVRTYIDIDCHE